MREDECDDPGEFDRPTDEANDLTVGRREYLKLTGGGIGFGAITILGGEVVQADDSGFGEGGYGMSPYGGEGLGVSTQGPTDVKPTTATMNGAVTELDDAESAECYFEWREKGSSSINTTSKRDLSSPGSFSADISGLTSGTDYEFWAVAEASDGDTATNAEFSTH